MTNGNLQALADVGVFIWLDDRSRDQLDSGNLAELVKVRNVVGVTTNPLPVLASAEERPAGHE